MSIFKHLKGIKRSKLIKHIFLLSILIYSCSVSILFSVVISSTNQTIESIKVPDGYFIGNFNASDPFLEIPVSVENSGVYDLTDFTLEISLEIEYFEANKTEEKEVEIFKKSKNFGIIRAGRLFEEKFKGDEEDFSIEALNEFWNEVDPYQDVDFLLSVKLSGKNFFGLVSFEYELDEIDLEDILCPECEDPTTLEAG